jgi:hypothetical protein
VLVDGHQLELRKEQGEMKEIKFFDNDVEAFKFAWRLQHQGYDITLGYTPKGAFVEWSIEEDVTWF